MRRIFWRCAPSICSIDPVIGGALISGGFSALGGGLSFLGGSSANEASANEARRNRDLQRELSQTAVQRRVQDLRAAGLNPMLAYNNAASTPSGAQAHFENPAQGATQAANSAGDAFSKIPQNKLFTEQVNAVRAGALKDATQASVNVESAEHVRRQQDATTASAQHLRAQADRLAGEESRSTALHPAHRSHAENEAYFKHLERISHEKRALFEERYPYSLETGAVSNFLRDFGAGAVTGAGAAYFFNRKKNKKPGPRLNRYQGFPGEIFEGN